MLALLSSIEPDPVMLPVTFLIVALLMLIEPEPGMPMSLCAVVRLFISMLPLPTTPIDDSLHIMLLIEMSPLPVIFSFSLSVSMPSFALKLPEPRTDTPLMLGEVTYTLTSLRGFLSSDISDMLFDSSLMCSVLSLLYIFIRFMSSSFPDTFTEVLFPCMK